MNKFGMMLVGAAVLCVLTGPVVASDADAESVEMVIAETGGGWDSLAMMGACLGAGVVVIGGGMGIGRISSHALESIARQPEAAGQMFLAWLIPAAMIEGATLFAVVVCFMVVIG